MEKQIVYGAKRGAGKTREMVLRQYLLGLNGNQISKKVGISRQAVGKHLASLRESGEIEG